MEANGQVEKRGSWGEACLLPTSSSQTHSLPLITGAPWKVPAKREMPWGILLVASFEVLPCTGLGDHCWLSYDMILTIVSIFKTALLKKKKKKRYSRIPSK